MPACATCGPQERRGQPSELHLGVACSCIHIYVCVLVTQDSTAGRAIEEAHGLAKWACDARLATLPSFRFSCQARLDPGRPPWGADQWATQSPARVLAGARIFTERLWGRDGVAAVWFRRLAAAGRRWSRSAARLFVAALFNDHSLNS